MASYQVTQQAIKGLVYLHRYRFLTITQFAKITELSRDQASDNLRRMERLGWLCHIENTPLAGQGQTPRVIRV